MSSSTKKMLSSESKDNMVFEDDMVFVKETASTKLIGTLSESNGWGSGGLIELHKYVRQNNVLKATEEIEYIKGRVDNHNEQNPDDQISLNTLLNTPIRFMNTTYERRTTMLDYANINNFSEIKSLLKAYGASETSLTSWSPSFWNTVNLLVNTVSETAGLSIKK